jgi:xylulose-5-phosphate/fructose-6-phosphate phosphoketolase
MRETDAALPPQQLELIDSWWRAANYLSVGQIYLLATRIIRRPKSTSRQQSARTSPR